MCVKGTDKDSLEIEIGGGGIERIQSKMKKHQQQTQPNGESKQKKKKLNK